VALFGRCSVEIGGENGIYGGPGRFVAVGPDVAIGVEGGLSEL
jgi:hypothetical protein